MPEPDENQSSILHVDLREHLRLKDAYEDLRQDYEREIEAHIQLQHTYMELYRTYIQEVEEHIQLKKVYGHLSMLLQKDATEQETKGPSHGEQQEPTSANRSMAEVIATQALKATVQARDKGTGEHSERIVQMAEATAYKLHRSEEEIHILRLAALFHDIGKIGVSDTILLKPGPLSPEEWEIMHHHPKIGRQILEQIGGVFSLLAKIIVAHHERWDGQGYPNHLTGESIPLGARILAVVDSYDAMTSDRPYRAAFSHADARAELLSCSGSQYDPNVVKAFLQVLDEQPEFLSVEASRQ